MWAKVGLKAKLNAMPRATYFQKIQKFDTSVYLLGWATATFDGLYTLQSLLRSPAADGKGADGNFNLGKYSNAKADALIDRVKTPHIAQVLMQKGYTRSIQEAFDRFLGKGAPAYFDKFRLEPAQAISMITEAEGVPVLAHPFTLNCASADELEHLVINLVSLGLAGIEVYYTEHSSKQISVFMSRLLDGTTCSSPGEAIFTETT